MINAKEVDIATMIGTIVTTENVASLLIATMPATDAGMAKGRDAIEIVVFPAAIGPMIDGIAFGIGTEPTEGLAAATGTAQTQRGSAEPEAKRAILNTPKKRVSREQLLLS